MTTATTTKTKAPRKRKTATGKDPQATQKRLYTSFQKMINGETTGTKPVELIEIEGLADHLQVVKNGQVYHLLDHDQELLVTTSPNTTKANTITSLSVIEHVAKNYQETGEINLGDTAPAETPSETTEEATKPAKTKAKAKPAKAKAKPTTEPENAPIQGTLESSVSVTADSNDDVDQIKLTLSEVVAQLAQQQKAINAIAESGQAMTAAIVSLKESIDKIEAPIDYADQFATLTQSVVSLSQQITDLGSQSEVSTTEPEPKLEPEIEASEETSEETSVEVDTDDNDDSMKVGDVGILTRDGESIIFQIPKKLPHLEGQESDDPETYANKADQSNCETLDRVILELEESHGEFTEYSTTMVVIDGSTIGSVPAADIVDADIIETLQATGSITIIDMDAEEEDEDE